jgi:hypothetical protein
MVLKGVLWVRDKESCLISSSTSHKWNFFNALLESDWGAKTMFRYGSKAPDIARLFDMFTLECVVEESIHQYVLYNTKS